MTDDQRLPMTSAVLERLGPDAGERFVRQFDTVAVRCGDRAALVARRAVTIAAVLHEVGDPLAEAWITLAAEYDDRLRFAAIVRHL